MAYEPKTKYNYMKFTENGGSMKKWMNQADLHFVFNSCLGGLRLKCFDYSGRLVWTASPRLEMDSDRMEIIHDLGIPHVLHTGEPKGLPWCWCVWCNPVDRSFGDFREIEYDQKGSLIRFVLAGCSAKEFPKDSACSVATYSMDDAEFHTLRSFILGGRRCLLTPHFSDK